MSDNIHFILENMIHGVREELEYENYVAENQLLMDKCDRCGVFYPTYSFRRGLCPKCLDDLMKLERNNNLYEM